MRFLHAMQLRRAKEGDLNYKAIVTTPEETVD